MSSTRTGDIGSPPSHDKRGWMKSVLDVDVPDQSAGMQAKEPKGNDPAHADDEPQAKGFFDGIKDSVVKFVKDHDLDELPIAGIDQLKHAFGSDASPDMAKNSDEKVLAALKDLADGTASLKKLGFDTKALEARHDELVGYESKAAALAGDEPRFKAFEKIKTQAREALGQAEELTKQLKSVMGDSKDPPTDEQKSAVYKKALEDLYGLSIEVAPGMTNTHFDKMFDMFGSVPKEQTKTGSLKKLLYSKTGGGVYYGADAKIEMGDFGTGQDEKDNTDDYEIDGKKVEVNAHDVTALHEIGHAVDHEHKLSDGALGKSGGGGWKIENAGSVTSTFVAYLKSSAGLSDKCTEQDLTTAVSLALRKGETGKLDTISPDDWQKIIPFLTDKCLKQRPDAKPWFAPAVVVGDRGYMQSTSSQWFSYEANARVTIKVNDYQWRSPKECFAELYAITWLKKKKPPAGVDASFKEYMWNDGA